MQTSAVESEHDLDKVMTSELEIGMHVYELDRPWHGTPSPGRSFRIESRDEIELLQKYCDYVFVSQPEQADAGAVDRPERPRGYFPVPGIIGICSNGAGDGESTADIALEDELETARGVYSDSHALISRVFGEIAAGGSVDLDALRQATTAIVDSVTRNPDAFMLMQRVDCNDSYRYRHAVNCCSLAAIFCNRLGYARDVVFEIALGAMLLDIGILRMPDEMLDTSSPLNSLIMKLVRHHVGFALDIADGVGGFPAVAREMIATHHERLDGRGYPAGLQDEEIPVCGRIAAIVDCYDAMVNDRPYRLGMSPTEAIGELYRWRNIDFHPGMVEDFIRTVGIYPTGTLVELDSGQVGIVISQNPVHRMYPVVLLVMDADGNRYEKPRSVDLWDCCRNAGGSSLGIRCALRDRNAGIDPSDYYPGRAG